MYIWWLWLCQWIWLKISSWRPTKSCITRLRMRMTNWPIDQFKIWYDLDEEKQAKGHSLLLWRPIFIFWHPNFETEHFVAIYRNWLASYFSEWGKQEMAHHPTPCVGSRRLMRKHSLDYAAPAALHNCTIVRCTAVLEQAMTPAVNLTAQNFTTTTTKLLPISRESQYWILPCTALQLHSSVGSWQNSYCHVLVFV